MLTPFHLKSGNLSPKKQQVEQDLKIVIRAKNNKVKCVYMTSAIIILASEQKIVSLIWIVVQNKQLRHLLINKSQTSERIVRDLSISPTKKNNCLDLFFKVTLCLCPKATQKQLFFVVCHHKLYKLCVLLFYVVLSIPGDFDKS